MPDSFLRMHHPRLFRNRTLIHGLREIPCFPVKYLFRYLKLTELDIWVLDTEGSELAVLSGVNFNRIKIKVIIMECDEHVAIPCASELVSVKGGARKSDRARHLPDCASVAPAILSRDHERSVHSNACFSGRQLSMINLSSCSKPTKLKRIMQLCIE
jgi:hypothetical protein